MPTLKRLTKPSATHTLLLLAACTATATTTADCVARAG